MADSVEVSTIETTDGTIGIIRDNAARQSIANLREGKETVGSVAWENVKGRPTKVSELENDKKYQTDENVSNTLNSTLYAGSSTHGGPATSADKLTTARTISLGGAAAGSGSFDGSANSTINVSSLDATKLTGVVPITNLPPSVVERMSVVKDDTERFALTKDKVQDGDVVKVQSSGLMYYVVDDDKLNAEAGYEVFKAGTAASVPWGGVTGKPSSYPPSSHTHTKSQITDFPSSLPNPSNLTMQIEGKNAAVYNGSASQTFNVTKSSLGLDKVNNTADADKSVKYAASTPWIGVTGKPSTFPPSAHTHTKSQITDLGVFGGASATAAGSAGLVPQPAAGDQDKYLSAKGTWESLTGKISGTKVTSANSADKLTTARTLTIGNTGKSFDGSANVSWSLSEIGAAAQNHNHDSTYLKLSGGTMKGQLLTSFKNSVATGSLQAAATTVPDLIQEVRYSSGCMGSVNLTTAYNSIPAAWYNFLYIPHRSGGVSGAAKDNNCNFGTLLLFGMTTTNQAWIVEFQSSKIVGTFSIRNTDHYSWSEITGKPSTFTPSSHTHTKDQVGLGNVANLDQSKAIKSITRSGTTFTATALDGTTSTFTQQDINTTYGLASQSSNGLMSAADKKAIDREFFRMVPKGGTVIPNGANLNSTAYLKVGNYYQSPNANTTNMTNIPSKVAFMMYVLSPLSEVYDNESTATWVYRLRIFITHSGHIFTQLVNSNTTPGSFNYGPWVKMTNSNDLGAVSNKSAKYTLTAAKWSGSSAPYTYDLGPTYGANAIIGFDSAVGNTTQLEAARAADIQGSSTTKIYAYGDKPTVDIPIVIIYQ